MYISGFSTKWKNESTKINYVVQKTMLLENHVRRGLSVYVCTVLHLVLELRLLPNIFLTFYDFSRNFEVQHYDISSHTRPGKRATLGKLRTYFYHCRIVRLIPVILQPQNNNWQQSYYILQLQKQVRKGPKDPYLHSLT